MYNPAYNERERPVDWSLMAALLGLMVVGAFFIHSASSVGESPVGRHWYQHRFIWQIVCYGLGLGAAAVVCLVPYHSLARWSMVAYLGCIMALVAVLIPFIGASRFGARRWIDFGFFQFQPSEFAKLSLILALANFLSRPADELKQPAVFMRGLGLMFLPFVLILKEPDLGSALVLMPVGLAMMMVAGVPLKFLGRLVGGLGILVVLLMVDILFAPPRWQIKLEDYQRKRLLVYFNREFAPQNATPAERLKARDQERKYSYNVEQALISVGSGGLTGKGYRQGTQNALGYLPRAVAHNDFIFSVIAEEKGFAGSVTVIALYTVVLFSGLRTAGQARDRLGRLLAVGVVALLFSHVFINIGMNIRLMPVTGIPLPLLSYGGSSVICSLIAIGLLQNVHLYRNKY